MAPWILLYPLLLVVLAFVAVYEYRSATTLSLPLSPALTILAILLPVFSFANAFALPALLTGPAHQRRRTLLVSNLLQALQLLQLVLSVVLATFFFATAAPSTVRNCLLSTTWQRLFASKNAAAIRHIQDTLDCCGFNSVRDRAWPFAEDLRGGGGVPCAERFGRQVACGGRWADRLQRVAGLEGGVSVTITVLQIAMFLLVRWATARQQSRWPRLLGPFANANSTITRGASRPLLGGGDDHDDHDEDEEDEEDEENEENEGVADAGQNQQTGEAGQRQAVDQRPAGGAYGTNGPRVEPSFNSEHEDQKRSTIVISPKHTMVARRLIAGALLLALPAASASPAVPADTHINGACKQLNIPVSASVDGAVFNIPQVNNDLEADAWAIYDATRTTPHDASNILKNTTLAGTWNIHAQLCFPTHPKAHDILQIASHGVHYDSRYWDSKYLPEQHSFVEAALKAGYSILTYDRLGVGQSDHPDAYQVVQANLELEILRQLTLMARNGSLYKFAAKAAPTSVAAFQKHGSSTPDKVVHIGHSFGSVLTSAFIATYGDLTDGAIITGYVYGQYLGSAGSVSFALEYAATGHPRFDRPSGYVVSKPVGIQTIFFGGDPATAYTPALFAYGVSIKQPVPVGEFASAYKILNRPGGSFHAPVQFLLPEHDFYICRGDCNNYTSVEQLQVFYPNATAIDLKIQPNTGHALPLHNNATAGFQLSFDFLGSHGL
ncbi:hypothetical protein SCUCBS95973_002907 [Sporothrix curviconia]|uniref:AB hydrolase-1 domain-containing protein n=1 Tax=Sporothrix curviconia TaxID=1260050 RepID=A0ABP0BB26_9PEZI